MINNSTKAETLKKLNNFLKKKKIKKLIIPNFVYFKKSDYLNDKEKIFFNLKNIFKKKKLIIRSSSIDEDKIGQTNAGKYLSFSNINIERKEILKSIEKIIEKFESPNDQILVQEFIERPIFSGVIFTREANYNSPYYVINYDESGKTNLVTSGSNNPTMQCEYVYRDKIKYSEKFYKFLKKIKIIESYSKSDRLDIEFAYKNNTWFLFQCRKLPIKQSKNDDIEIDKALVNLNKKIIKLKNKNPTLSGKTTYFSNMSDWNPAEMIGNKPKPLAISLYSELITNKIWRIQRKDYGYKDTFPNILMVNLAGTPFIDLRTDINSFLPKGLNVNLENKLVNNYLNKLKSKPYLHDKIEFDLLLTCYDLKNDDKKIDFLNLQEKKIYKKKLKQLTQNLLLNSRYIFKQELQKINSLNLKINALKKSRLSEIQKIFFLIEDCKNFGTLPFAGAARMEFVTTQILRNLIEKKLLNELDIQKLYESIPTITKEIFGLSKKALKDKTQKKLFIKKFGHLRPSTYSINSLNYKEGFNIYFSKSVSNNRILKKEKFVLSKKKHKEISDLLKKNNINITSKNFFNILNKSIQFREYFKFIFSKSINEIFSSLNKLGKQIGIKREELEYISIDKIINSYSVLETRKLSQILKEEIRNNKKSFSITKKIVFPDFIASEKDIYFQKLSLTKGNFITSKRISGRNIYLNNSINFKKIKDKIVLIDNADPGYDFIFSHNIRGLVTKYGGANSHMAIRCLELSIPAVIGVGNSDFEKIKNSNFLELDCEQKNFKIIN